MRRKHALLRIGITSIPPVNLMKWSLEVRKMSPAATNSNKNKWWFWGKIGKPSKLLQMSKMSQNKSQDTMIWSERKRWKPQNCNTWHRISCEPHELEKTQFLRRKIDLNQTWFWGEKSIKGKKKLWWEIDLKQKYNQWNRLENMKQIIFEELLFF